MIYLGVNIDHVATLRNARLPAGERALGEAYPDVVRAALICQKAGAHSIVMHLREDRRHVRDADLFQVKKALSIGLNMEMSVAPDILRTAVRLRPAQATLVPEKRMERTTEGGLNLLKGTAVRRCVDSLQEKKITVSLFIDPDLRQVEAAARMRAEAVEFHTGDYARQTAAAGRSRELNRLRKAARLACEAALVVNAGHGLDYSNVGKVAAIPGMNELNIGYSIITRSLYTGLEAAVKEMIRKVQK